MKEILWILLVSVSLVALIRAWARARLASRRALQGTGLPHRDPGKDWYPFLRWALILGLLVLVGIHYAMDPGLLRAGLNLFLFMDRYHALFVVLLALNVVGVIFAWRARSSPFDWVLGLSMGVAANILFVKSRAISYENHTASMAWDSVFFFLLLALSVVGVILAWRARLRRLGWLCAAMITAVGVGLYLSSVLYGLPEDFADIEDQFKYGSIGSDHFMARGIPYYIWKVLPKVFPPEQILQKKYGPKDVKSSGEEYWPINGKSGYEAFGLVKEDNKTARLVGEDNDHVIDRPIGFSKRKVFMMDFIGLNCAFCHVSTIRDNAQSAPRIVLGMPANTVDIELFFLFLFTAAEQKNFTSKVMDGIRAQNPDMGSVEQLVYRGLSLVTRYYLQQLKKEFYFIDPHNPDRNPRFGPGRVDAWGPGKTTLAKPAQRVDFPGGIIDHTSIWNQKARAGMRLHWDGNIDVLAERNIIAGLVVTGPAIECLDKRRLDRINNWIEGRPAPRLEDFQELNGEQASGTAVFLRQRGATPTAVGSTGEYHPNRRGHFTKPKEKGNDKEDQAKRDAEPEMARLVQGRRIYERWCASCHAQGGDRVGRVEPLNELNTDPARATAFTAELAAALNTIETKDWKLQNFKNQKGYVNMLLDGVWLRAPYLHNGSVPTLQHLLNKPCQGFEDKQHCRPRIFYRGQDLYDWKRVGFKWEKTIDSTDRVKITFRDRTKEFTVDEKGIVRFLDLEVNLLGLSAAEAEERILEALIAARVKELRFKKPKLKADQVEKKVQAQFITEAVERLRKFEPNLSDKEGEERVREKNPLVTVQILGEPPKFFAFDTTQLGNSNHGHLYGTDLDADEQEALIEFLKTL